MIVRFDRRKLQAAQVESSLCCYSRFLWPAIHGEVRVWRPPPRGYAREQLA